MKKILALILVAGMMAAAMVGCAAPAAEAPAAEAPAAEAPAAEPAAPAEEPAAPAEEPAAPAEEPAADTTGATEGVQADEAFYANADLSVLSGKKIGITIQSLENPYWAGVMSALEEVLDAAGADATIVACDDNSANQISQIENFTTAGCDLIMIHPSDAAAVEDYAAMAREAGIKVMCWDDPMTNTDGNWILDNTYLGTAIGEMAGEFVAEHYSADNKAKVIVLGYPQTKVLLERANGIKMGLENTCAGMYEIIAEPAAIEANDALKAVETTLQQHPDCKIAVGVGAGAMIGANEAFVIHTGGNIPDDMGIFTTDVTKQQLDQISDPGQASRAIIGFEGSDVDTAEACAKMFALILGEKLESQNVFRGVGRITDETAQAIRAEMK